MTKIIYPKLGYKIQGCIYDIYETFRYLKLSEEAWEEALYLELLAKQVEVERQREFEYYYKGKRIGRFFVDLLVEEKIILELKAVPQITPIDEAQCIAYLKVSNLKLAILTNFNFAKLSIKRMPNLIKAIDDKQQLPYYKDMYSLLVNHLLEICVELYQIIGSGFMAMHYRRAFRVELKLHHITYQIKNKLDIIHRNHVIQSIGTYLIVIEDKILMTIVAVKHISKIHKGRMQQFLKLLNKQFGIIVNFHGRQLQVVFISP